MLAGVTIVEAASPDEMQLARQLFQEYATSLGFSLCFQDFDRELAALPGEYAPPGGCLLLARCGRRAAGCVALRQLAEGACEMKRLYVRPEFRGQGLGRALCEKAIALARQFGHRCMKLDTVSNMHDALALYRSLGFHECAPYRHNPLPGAVYLELALVQERGQSNPGRG
jgi:ribosomal protein S18 acetylase RimI-like enzyme